MINLECGQDVVQLGIKTYEGWNITAFLDHLDLCDKCADCKKMLIGELNELIGGSQSSSAMSK